MRTAYRAAGSLILAAIFIGSIVTDADARRRHRYRGAPPAAEGMNLQREGGAVCNNILRDVELGIAACTRIIESSSNPKSRFLATFLRGQGYTAKMDYDSAIRDFDEAIRINEVLRVNANGLIHQGRA